MKMVKFRKEVNGFAAIRRKLGYTQKELAERLGVDRTLVVKVEDGKRSFPLAALMKLAALEKAIQEKQPEPRNDIS